MHARAGSLALYGQAGKVQRISRSLIPVYPNTLSNSYLLVKGNRDANLYYWVNANAGYYK